MTISQFQVLRPLNLSSLKLTDEQFYQLCIVEIYRIDRTVELIESGNSIDCDDVLPGFTLDLMRICDRQM